MHTALFKESEQPRFTQYYLDVENKLFQASDKKHEYYMADEDFYLYLLAHEYKHCLYTGTGLRSLVDLYVFNQSKGKLDWNYLEQELKRIGIFEFEKNMRELSEKAFSPKMNSDILSETERIELNEFLFSSTYGTTEIALKNRIRNQLAGDKRITATGKIKYLMRRLFPEKAYMETWCPQYAPYIAQHRWLMPIAPIWRIVKRGVEKRKQVKAEFDTIRKA